MSSSKDLISEIFTEWEEQYSNIPSISIPTTQPPTTTATILTSSSDELENLYDQILPSSTKMKSYT